MHTSVLFFYDDSTTDVADYLEQFYQDSDEHSEFVIEIDYATAKEKYKEEIGDVKRWGVRLPAYLDYKKRDDPAYYFVEEYGYGKDDEGNLGYYANPNGMFDYYEIGGRWKNTLFEKRRIKSYKCSDVKLSKIDWDTMYNNMAKTMANYDEYKARGGEERLKKTLKSKGLNNWFFSIMDDEGFFSAEDDADFNKALKMMIKKHKDNNNARVCVIDMHS